MKKEDIDEFIKKSSDSSTQSRYIDASGKEFSPGDIILGFKPKKPYKIHSLGKRVGDPNFGKTKAN